MWHPSPAVDTQSAGQVWVDDHAVTGLEVAHTLAHLDHAPGVLVAQHDAWVGGMPWGHVEDVQVRAADAHSLDFQQDVIGLLDLGDGHVLKGQLPFA